MRQYYLIIRGTSITLITKAGKDITRKQNYSPRSLINIDAKFLDKILANKIQLKRIIHHEQVGFISGMQGLTFEINTIHINSIKKKHNQLNKY